MAAAGALAEYTPFAFGTGPAARSLCHANMLLRDLRDARRVGQQDDLRRRPFADRLSTLVPHLQVVGHPLAFQLIRDSSGRSSRFVLADSRTGNVARRYPAVGIREDSAGSA